MWAQIVFFTMMCVTLGAKIQIHGKPREGDNNAWHVFVDFCITNILLYFGGFYDCFLN